MESEIRVNSDNELRESISQQPGLLKLVSSILSYIFHPVFIPLYVLYLLIFIQPFLFVGVEYKSRVLVFLQGVLMYTFFPLVSVGLLKALGFISSIKLKTRKDRIIPYIICNIWYFWIWYVWHNLDTIPVELEAFALSIFLASSIGLLFNIYIKISMHGMALGTATAFLCMVSFHTSVNLTGYIGLSILITGLVCTARLLLSDHTSREIIAGLFTGVGAIIIAAAILL